MPIVNVGYAIQIFSISIDFAWETWFGPDENESFTNFLRLRIFNVLKFRLWQLLKFVTKDGVLRSFHSIQIIILVLKFDQNSTFHKLFCPVWALIWEFVMNCFSYWDCFFQNSFFYVNSGYIVAKRVYFLLIKKVSNFDDRNIDSMYFSQFFFSFFT